MLVVLADSGEIEVDHSDEPFQEAGLYGPEAYRADLEAYPRDKVPVWMAAYLDHGDRHRRTPQVAAAQARADRDVQVWAALAENEFPPFPAMWARWATIGAAFVAAQLDRAGFVVAEMGGDDTDDGLADDLSFCRYWKWSSTSTPVEVSLRSWLV